MTEQDVEIIAQRALEAFPDARPRIISDNGPQFVAKDFKAFIRIKGMDHVRTSPYYPQSNGKLERWHKSLKSECIRPKTPLDLDEARRLVSDYVDDYNQPPYHRHRKDTGRYRCDEPEKLQFTLNQDNGHGQVLCR
jgi:putative transposase